MGIIKNTEYYNRTVTRIAMKSRELLTEDITLIKEAYNNNSRDVIYDFALKNKVLPFTAKLLYDLSIDKIFWEDIYSSFEKRSETILAVLVDVFDDFKAKGVNKIFLYENFGALLASETSIGCFASGDVDLYADISLKEDITDVLIDAGFLPKETNASTDTVKIEYFNEKLLEKGFGINVMWKPLSRLKLPFQINIDNSIQWDDLNNYKNTNIQIPNKNALMYLCLLHTSVHGYHRAPDIRLYTDTDRVSLLQPNWDIIFDYAQLDRAEVRVLTSAILSNKLLNMPFSNNKIVESYKKKHKNINILVKRVFDSKNKFLKSEPRGMSVLLIEILSSDSGWIKSSFEILFPSKRWIREYYLQNKGYLLNGYIMHFKNLFF
tara:strand:+ start:16739 stop:17872 length:1134 start_codon:yes stop_codon:yes gene_type:complete